MIVFLLLLGDYSIAKMMTGFRFSYLELYIVLLVVIVPVVAAIMANREFGQPLIYGILVQRKMLLAGTALMLLQYIRRGVFTLADVYRALISLSWFTLILYTVLWMFVDPSRYVQYGIGLVGGMSIGAPRFKFDTVFLIIGFLRYALLGFRTGKWKPYLVSLPFAVYLFVDGQRNVLLALAITLIIMIWRWGTFPRLVVWTPKFMVVLLVVIGGVFIAKPAYVFQLGHRFNDAITVVMTGETTDDISANARIVESRLALPYIEEHWLLGNGDLSKQWQFGYQSIFRWFYPSDIGVVGVIYLYGVFGCVLFSMQFLFAIRYAKRLSGSQIESVAVVDMAKAYLMYYAVNSLIIGKFVYSVEVGLIFIAILYAAGLPSEGGSIPAPSMQRSVRI